MNQIIQLTLFIVPVTLVYPTSQHHVLQSHHQFSHLKFLTLSTYAKHFMYDIISAAGFKVVETLQS
jgi:hypothetical protein